MILDLDDPDDDNPYFILDKYRQPLMYLLRNVLDELSGYGDYTITLPVDSDHVSLEEMIERDWCLRYLAKNKIINYVEKEDGDTISIINRYNLEALSLLLEGHEEDIERLPNLIYYQPSTGKGFVNGNYIRLKNISKKLFDVLFMAAPESASRDKLKRAVKASKARDNGSAYAVSEAFTNLRKACKVDAKVIALHDDGKLEAQVFTLGETFFDGYFSID